MVSPFCVFVPRLPPRFISLLLQVFKKFVEVGRVALINDGPDQGKLCVILDVVDQRRVSYGRDWPRFVDEYVEDFFLE